MLLPDDRDAGSRSRANVPTSVKTHPKFSKKNAQRPSCSKCSISSGEIIRYYSACCTSIGKELGRKGKELGRKGKELGGNGLLTGK
jgi:hypothetical protein